MLLLSIRDFHTRQSSDSLNHEVVSNYLESFATNLPLPDAIHRLSESNNFSRALYKDRIRNEYTLLTVSEIEQLTKSQMDAMRITLIDDLPTSDKEYLLYYPDTTREELEELRADSARSGPSVPDLGGVEFWSLICKHELPFNQKCNYMTGSVVRVGSQLYCNINPNFRGWDKYSSIDHPHWERITDGTIEGYRMRKMSDDLQGQD